MVRVVYGALAFVAAGLLIAAAVLVYFLKTLPDLSHLLSREITQSTKIYDRTGSVLLYEIHGEERRTVIPSDQIPEYVKQATIAVEDERFYEHSAFDWRSIARALGVDILSGGIEQGGSTITQQLVKNAFLTPEQTPSRKIREIILAIRMERAYSKDEILGLYLNQIPYGSNSYGIEAASRTFFEKSASDLSLAQAALLAALPQRPSYFSPYGSHVPQLKKRQEIILSKMVSFGFISQEQADQAKEEKLVFVPPKNSLSAPHFVLFVREYLNDRYGEAYVERAGLTVITTLDAGLQKIAETVVAEGAERNTKLYNGRNAALMAQNPKTGEILAMVGSADYFDIAHDGNFNVVTQGLRQPGSSFKPFAYLTAFAEGYTPDTVVFDLPTEFDTTNNPKHSYTPGNYDHKFRGPMTLRDALAQSVNIPAVKVMYLAGIDDTIETAKRLGITTLTDRSRYGLSLVLGGGEIKLIEMIKAYSVFATEGMQARQTAVLSVTDASGRVLESHSQSQERVFDPEPIRELNAVLSDPEARAPLFGPHSALTIPGHEIAAKTGTTNDFRDAWTIGYTPSLVAGVWVGNNDNSPMNVGGSSILAASPIWNAFMTQALADADQELFTRPESVPTSKQVLTGSYVVSFSIGSSTYPQVHDILFYVDKSNPRGPLPSRPEDDPQFANWELPVLSWARNNIPSFDLLYNKPIPQEYQLLEGGAYQPSVVFESPQTGAFVSSPFPVRATVSAPLGVKSLSLLLNGVVVDSVTVSPSEARPGVGETASYPKEYMYVGEVRSSLPELQNLLRVEVVDQLENKASDERIVFR
jgi:1A family penicillin-binding protein